MKPTVHDYRDYVFTISYRVVEPIFADFPEIITSGDSLTQAFAHACEALDLHLESLRKLGLRVPKPRHRLLVEAR